MFRRPAIQALLLALLLTPLATNAEGCPPGSEKRTIDSEIDAACYLLYVAGELAGYRDWCVALTGERQAWEVALELWMERNGDYLDAASRLASGGEEAAFGLDSPLIADRAPAIQVGERRCERYRHLVNQGRFDVDLERSLRPLRRYLRD